MTPHTPPRNASATPLPPCGVCRFLLFGLSEEVKPLSFSFQPLKTFACCLSYLGCTGGCIFTAALAAGLTMSYLSVDKLQLEIYCSPDAIDWQAQPLRHDTACSSMSKVAVDPDLLLFFVRRQDENQWPRGVKRAEALNMQKEQSYARKIYPLVEPNSEANQGSCWAKGLITCSW